MLDSPHWHSWRHLGISCLDRFGRAVFTHLVFLVTHTDAGVINASSNTCTCMTDWWSNPVCCISCYKIHFSAETYKSALTLQPLSKEGNNLESDFLVLRLSYSKTWKHNFIMWCVFWKQVLPQGFCFTLISCNHSINILSLLWQMCYFAYPADPSQGEIFIGTHLEWTNPVKLIFRKPKQCIKGPIKDL